MMRNVIVIVIDCLRVDHVSAYGYHRATTPTIDALADRGVTWKQAFAASSWTKPSVTSLFTGLYPSQHGVFRGVKRRANQTKTTTDVLPAVHPTLAERFVDRGWRCGAFMNNAQIGAFTGLNRGFDPYIPDGGKADCLIERFLDWFSADRTKPAFAYIHFLEAHYPYRPRRRHVAMFGGDRDTNPFCDYSARDYGRLRRAIQHKEQQLSEDELTQMVQMYDGAVRRLDGKIKLILAALKEMGVNRETAVFVTADHGEELLEHGQIGHGQSLYDELIHVPLVAVVPGLEGSRRIDSPTSLVSLPDLLLRLADADGDPNAMEAVFTNEADAAVFAELILSRRYFQTIRTAHWKLHRRFKFARDEGQSGPIRSPWALASESAHETVMELYDVVGDPREQTNLIDDPAVATVQTQLLTRLDAWWKDVGEPTAETGSAETEIDDRVVQRLRDLGYLE